MNKRFGRKKVRVLEALLAVAGVRIVLEKWEKEEVRRESNKTLSEGD